CEAWAAPVVSGRVASSAPRGVEPLRYDGLDQDELGVWHSPAGALVAWFRDPDGNVLSVTQHAHAPPAGPGWRRAPAELSACGLIAAPAPATDRPRSDRAADRRVHAVAV